jgi:transcriptional regulator with XRE-family HTH domain
MAHFSKLIFAAFVKGLREERKLSLRETAKKSGLTLARVFAIEKGDTRVSVPQLQALAAAFDFETGSDLLRLYEEAMDKAKLRSKRKAPRDKIYTFDPPAKARPRRLATASV